MAAGAGFVFGAGGFVATGAGCFVTGAAGPNLEIIASAFA